MRYVWCETDRSRNLAMYGLDFVDAAQLLAGRSRRLCGFSKYPGSVLHAIDRMRGVPVAVVAAVAPDGWHIRLLTFRPAVRWEVRLYNRHGPGGELAQPAQPEVVDGQGGAAGDGGGSPAECVAAGAAGAAGQTSLSDWGRFDPRAWPEPKTPRYVREALLLAGQSRTRKPRERVMPPVKVKPKRGRPATGNARQKVTFRIPHNVLKLWGASGRGWHTRMVAHMTAREPGATTERHQTAALDIPAPVTRRRGYPALGETRRLVTLRIPKDALECWRQSGPGWQTRMVARLSEP